jgi:uncharacterized phiE125 gp8 family phage protein
VGLALLQAPAAPIVTLEEAQLHVRSENVAEGPLLDALVLAATGQAEAYCRRRFVTQRWRLTLDEFPADAIVLPHPPLATVESVKWVDRDVVLQTLAPADYVVRPYETPGEIVPARGVTWPSAIDEPDAVQVEFTCGYGDPSAVPEAIRRAVLLLVGTLYANRESVAPVAMQEVPHTVQWLLGPYRVLRFAA